MSIASRPTSLDGPSPNGVSRGSRRPLDHPDPGVASRSIDIDFGVSVGGLGASRLAGETRRGLSRSRTSTVPIRIRLSVETDATPDGPSRQTPVVAEAVITVDGRPLGAAAASFAVVDTLRGVLTFGSRRLHLDLADGVGPWIRCSMPRHSAIDPTAVADGAAAADATNLSASAYCWLRPLSDWRFAGGTATPRLVSMSITGRDLAELGGRVAPMTDRLASSEMRHGAAGS